MRANDRGEVCPRRERVAAARIMVDGWVERWRYLEPVGEGQSVEETLGRTGRTVAGSVRLGRRHQRRQRGGEAQGHATHQQQAAEGEHGG